MAEAKKCDRCGKLYEFYPDKDNGNNRNYVNGIVTASIFKDGGKYFVVDIIDLCPQCLEGLRQWLDDYIDKPDNEKFIKTNLKDYVRKS